MKISILTLFPEMFIGPFSVSIIKHAQEKGLAEINFINIRDFGIGSHKTVDDTPYGGGIGMILKVDVLKAALDSVKDSQFSKDEQKTILLTADGQTYTERTAERYSQLKHLIIICGHYEGVDERVRNYIDEEVSIGDVVLTGGEIPAMLITDSVVRLISGVLKDGVTSSESFSHADEDGYLLEYPLFTKPQIFEGLTVPDVLLSGNHKEIAAWRNNESKKHTLLRRPDLNKKG